MNEVTLPSRHIRIRNSNLSGLRASTLTLGPTILSFTSEWGRNKGFYKLKEFPNKYYTLRHFSELNKNNQKKLSVNIFQMAKKVVRDIGRMINHFCY